MSNPTQTVRPAVEVPIVTVEVEDEGVYQGILTDIGSTTVGFAFPAQNAPGLPVGEIRSMQVGAERMGSSVQIQGRTESRWEDVRRVSYRVEVGNDDLTALAILIERRGAQRVDPGRPLRCLLFSLDGGERVEGVLEDISSTGVRVHVQGEPNLSKSEAITLCTHLPGDDDTLEVVALVRNCDATEGGMTLGLEFVARAAVEFTRILERVERFVMYRQAECLQALVAADEQAA